MTDQKPIAAGKSSFDYVEAEKVLDALELDKRTVFLDAASGKGSYALLAAERLKERGQVIALDLWKEGIASLQEEAKRRELVNLRADVADLRSLPLQSQEVDTCLLATVLHDLVEDGTAEGALEELFRVIRPGGRLVIVEFDKVEGPPGPPKEIRLTSDEVKQIVRPFGFHPSEPVRAGSYHYMLVFTRQTGEPG